MFKSYCRCQYVYVYLYMCIYYIPSYTKKDVMPTKTIPTRNCNHVLKYFIMCLSLHN